ncbi:Glucose dehydrogenase [FAD, quinone] [Orchesella cincta]|uniref:Glucose dehydrogenase [FAD, quinone] n=1 Tax=Orchesella cincta TaxID=48709 RepID=A0A1D2N8I9_ORCCI|nr:Glucose dehydrogenase [FAD, quinone] [Orchesella cincta]
MGLVDGLNTVLNACQLAGRCPLPASAVIVTAYSGNQLLGGAGMVVATRIANASSSNRVLLLEAGGEPSILNGIPSMDFFLLNQQANTWIYNSTVQNKSCQSCDGKRALTTRGKMLGGSTSINFMMYVRGNKEDFNRWATDAGDNSWNYENVLPYFKKSEDYNGAFAGDASSSQYHGKGGLLNVATTDYMPGADDFLAAAAEKGYTIGDYNGENQEDGWRESTYRAFYTDTGKPNNLCIKKYAHVTKINFRNVGGKPRATGVTYQRHNLTRTVTARKEVIVSAGTFGSPKLLQLSGVGPARHLQSLKIPVVKDLPVGQNLNDHAYTIVGPFMKTPSLNPNRDVTVQAATQFLLSGNGALAAPAGLAGCAFFTSPVAEPAYPDLQVVQFSVALYPELSRDLNRLWGLRTDILDNWFDPYQKQNTDARFLVLWAGRPKSVGTVTLKSTNPNDNPNIDPQYLVHPDDTEALLFGFKKIVDLFENSNALNTTIFPKPVPGCENLTFKSDDYYRCVIKNLSGSLYHHVGTNALGKVVDSKLKVKGIDGLRVIDASIMPRVPNGNTQAATIMIAEKGSDLIIADM